MSARFIRRGVSKILWSPTIVDKFSVTRPELAAAEDISKEVADMAGWLLENNSVATPDMGSSFEGSIPGTDQVGDSTITFYEDMDVEEIEALFPKLAAGYVILLRKGDKPGSNSLDCFPSRVASKGNEFSTGNDPARFVVKYNITDEPGLDGPVPNAGPAITTVAPATGAAAGATPVTITGTNLTGTTDVTFGGVAATAVTVVSATEVTCTTAAHAAGVVDVVLTSPSGTATKTGGFTYTA